MHTHIGLTSCLTIDHFEAFNCSLSSVSVAGMGVSTAAAATWTVAWDHRACSGSTCSSTSCALAPQAGLPGSTPSSDAFSPLSVTRQYGLRRPWSTFDVSWTSEFASSSRRQQRDSGSRFTTRALTLEEKTKAPSGRLAKKNVSVRSPILPADSFTGWSAFSGGHCTLPSSTV